MRHSTAGATTLLTMMLVRCAVTVQRFRGSDDSGSGPLLPASSAEVVWEGRIQTAGGSVTFDYPGVCATLAISVTAVPPSTISIMVKINDGYGGVQSKQHFIAGGTLWTVTVNGQRARALYRTRQGLDMYVLPGTTGSSWQLGDIIVARLCKVSEADFAQVRLRASAVTVHGFVVHGGTVVQSPTRARRIEVIGDSLSAGFGSLCGAVQGDVPVLPLPRSGGVVGNDSESRLNRGSGRGSHPAEDLFQRSAFEWTAPGLACTALAAHCNVVAASGFGLIVNR